MTSLRPYAQLVRLPNVFTALADIVLAALAARALPGMTLPFLLVAFASVGFYWAGMVLNDVFDVEQDRRERPHRPIPSGRVSRRAAAALGVALLAGGLLFALLAGLAHPNGPTRAPLVVGVLLTGAILAYDGWLKPTWAGPVMMGACRGLNVLLGLAAFGALKAPWAPHLATIVTLYIIGVTWFARTEARVSNQQILAIGAVLMLGGLLLALILPTVVEPVSRSFLFPYLLVGLGFLVGLPVVQAIYQPTPPLVQAAVKRALLGLVLLDAVLATAFVGALGLGVALLAVPILLLARWRWLYAT